MAIQTQGRNRGGTAQAPTGVGVKGAAATPAQEAFIAKLNREGTDAAIALIKAFPAEDTTIQLATIDTLLELRNGFDAAIKAEKLTKAAASKRIEFLLGTNAIFKRDLAKAPKASQPVRKLVDPGFYLFQDSIFKVVATRDGQRVYAKQLVIDKTADTVEWVFAGGTVGQLTEDHRLTAEQAIQFSKLNERCAICAKRIKAGLSVERGIGPTCWRKAGF